MIVAPWRLDTLPGLRDESLTTRHGLRTVAGNLHEKPGEADTQHIA
jgi:hypothetical protein